MALPLEAREQTLRYFDPESLDLLRSERMITILPGFESFADYKKGEWIEAEFSDQRQHLLVWGVEVTALRRMDYALLRLAGFWHIDAAYDALEAVHGTKITPDTPLTLIATISQEGLDELSEQQKQTLFANGQKLEEKIREPELHNEFFQKRYAPFGGKYQL